MNLPQRLQNFENSIGEQVLLGTVAGDATLVKRYKKGGTRIQICHSENQKEYLEWKIKILEDFGIKFGEPYKMKEHNTILYRSNTYQELNWYHRKFYRNKTKIIRREILNLFQPLALAVWIQDDGNMCKGENIIRLHTEGFSEREKKMICRYFASVWHITAKINIVRNNLKCIVFGVNGTKKLIEIIKPFIVPSMEYKIKLIPRMSVEERNKKFALAGIPTRFLKGHIPWNKKF